VKKENLIQALICATIVSGCATIPYEPYAREVKKIPATSGVIALRETHQAEDRLKADQLMQSNCAGKSIEVLEEGEIATGTQTNASAKKTNDQENQGGVKIGSFVFGGAEKDAENTNTQSTVTTLKEWRINYQCLTKVSAPPLPLKAGKKSASKTVATP
jgi:hypothetical protein